MNSKAKGGSFEREIGKFLTKWASGQDKIYWFYRCPTSGALATIKDQQNLTGDLISVIGESKPFIDIFSIECKVGYSNADFFKIFKSTKNNELEIFWKQACHDANKGNKHPLLIFRKKSMKPICAINEFIFNKFKAKLKNLNFIFVNFLELPKCYFFDLESMFNCINWDDILNLKEELNGKSR